MTIIFYIFIAVVELILSLGFIFLALGTSTVGNRYFYNETNFGYVFFELGIAFSYTIFWSLINYLFLTQISWLNLNKIKTFKYLLKFIVLSMLIFSLIMVDSIIYFKQKNKHSLPQSVDHRTEFGNKSITCKYLIIS
jgi:hypothetical protein